MSPSPPRTAFSFSSADVLLLLVVGVWGTDFTVLKSALEVMHPHVANALRFSVAAVVLGAVYVARQREELYFTPLWNSWQTLLPVGLLGFGVHQVLFVIGLKHTTAGSAALIMATNPIWTALLSWAVGDESLAPRVWGGLVLSLAGTGLVVGGAVLTAGAGTLFGNATMLAAAMAFGGYTALSRRVVDQSSPTAMAFFGVLFALPVLLGVGVVYEPTVDWATAGWRTWGAILFSGGLAGGLMFVLWNRGVRRVGSSNTALYYYLVPVIGVVVGAVALGEAVTLAQVCGGSLIIGGLLLGRSR